MNQFSLFANMFNDIILSNTSCRYKTSIKIHDMAIYTNINHLDHHIIFNLVKESYIMHSAYVSPSNFKF